MASLSKMIGIILRNQMYSFIIFITCLIRIPSTSLTILFKDIPSEKCASVNAMANLVVKWKKHYLLVCELVARVNDFIGKPLLIFMAYVFLTFVGHTFYVMHDYFSSTSLPSPEIYAYGYSIFRNGICVICLATISEKISLEVSITSQLS